MWLRPLVDGRLDSRALHGDRRSEMLPSKFTRWKTSLGSQEWDDLLHGLYRSADSLIVYGPLTNIDRWYHLGKSKSEINKYCPKESEIWDDCDACEGDPCQNGGHCQNTDNFRSCSRYRLPSESVTLMMSHRKYWNQPSLKIPGINEQVKVSNVSVRKDSKVIAVKSTLFRIRVFHLHVSMVFVANVTQPTKEPPAARNRSIGVIVLLALKVTDVKYK